MREWFSERLKLVDSVFLDDVPKLTCIWIGKDSFEHNKSSTVK